MTDESTDDNRGRSHLIGTIVARVIVPLYVLAGAISKFASATPFKLPHWMQDAAATRAVAAFDGRGPAWVNEFVMADHLLPEVAAESLLLRTLKLILAVELVSVGLMFFVPRLARAVAILILTAFCFVLGAEIIHHASEASVPIWDAAFSGDCGCFGGAVAVPPGIMLLIDAALLALAVRFRPRPATLDATPKWGIACMLAWLVLGATLALNPRVPSEEVQTPWHELQPYFWKGHPVDETIVARALSIDHALFNGGKQVWILYRETCPSCHSLFAERYSAEEMDRVIVAIKIPVPANERSVDSDLGPMICPTCEWFDLPEGEGYEELSSPIELFVDENGIIESVRNAMLEGHPRVGDDS